MGRGHVPLRRLWETTHACLRAYVHEEWEHVRRHAKGNPPLLRPGTVERPMTDAATVGSNRIGKTRQFRKGRSERRRPAVPAACHRSLTTRSEVLRLQSRVLRDARQHSRPDFLPVVKGENEIGPARPFQRPVRARLPFRLPAAPRPPAPGALACLATPSCGPECNIRKVRTSLPMLKPLGHRAKRQGLRSRNGFISRGPIAHRAGQFEHLSNPATVLLLLHLDPEDHGRSSMPPLRYAIQRSAPARRALQPLQAPGAACPSPAATRRSSSARIPVALPSLIRRARWSGRYTSQISCGHHSLGFTCGPLLESLRHQP